MLLRAAVVSALAEPVGAVIGLTGADLYPSLNAAFLSLAAGAMAFVSMHGLLPIAPASVPSARFAATAALPIYGALNPLITGWCRFSMGGLRAAWHGLQPSGRGNELTKWDIADPEQDGLPQPGDRVLLESLLAGGGVASNREVSTTRSLTATTGGSPSNQSALGTGHLPRMHRCDYPGGEGGDSSRPRHQGRSCGRRP